MFGNLYIKPSKATDLQAFGQTLCRELGLTSFTERESSNYLEGRYLTTQCLGVVVHLALTDDAELAGYPFWLNLKADGFWTDEPAVFEGLADLLARKLTLAGHIAARCPDDGRTGADIWRYAVKENSRGVARGEIEIVVTKPATPNAPS